jgi:hypothetical protein
MKLTELLQAIKDENKEGMVSIDDWRWPDVDHLVAMGFEFGDDFRMITNKEPKITIYKKRDNDGKGKDHQFFFVEEPKRETKRFKNFNDVIDYFDTYSQPELDKNM